MRMAWGKAQEAATLFALANLFPDRMAIEVGLCLCEGDDLPPSWGFQPGSLPPLGASPDALITHTAGQDAGMDGDTPQGLANHHLDVVEVKNTCPFGMVSSRRANGKLHARYVVSDRGPRERVAVDWVPQLQLQMLCSGTPSALLASRSATKGIRVFRMARDEVYLRQMLAVASRLWTAHVLLRCPPPADAYTSMPEYGAFLQRTVQIAHNAEVVAAVADCEIAPCADRRPFLD